MKCRYCDEEISFQYYKSMNDQLQLTESCFICNFWIKKIPHRDSARTVIYKGNHYYIGKGGGDKRFCGFAGTKWKIVFEGNSNMADEEDKLRDRNKNIIRSIVYTSDLWDEGKIPKRFLKYLPDNALELVAIG